MKKNFSKIVVVFMMVALALGLVACSSGVKNSKYVGEWKVVSGTASGVTVDAATIGLDMTMNLKADGTVSVDYAGRQGSGKWEDTGSGVKISSDGDTLEAKDVNGQLEMLEPSSGVTMIFSKK